MRKLSEISVRNLRIKLHLKIAKLEVGSEICGCVTRSNPRGVLSIRVSYRAFGDASDEIWI